MKPREIFNKGEQILARQPVKARARRGAPTPAEMVLLARAERASDRRIGWGHCKGEPQPETLTLLWEMAERGWFTTPQAPKLLKNNERIWTFTMTQSGLEAYRREFKTYQPQA